MLSRAEFERLFDTFTSSAWRLETQGVYDEPEEREPLRRFLADDPDDLVWMADWFVWIREITGTGKRFGWVRVRCGRTATHALARGAQRCLTGEWSSTNVL